MSKQYSPRHFFRKAPNFLLKQYFDKHSVLAGLDFEKLSETKVEPIYTAWLAISEDTRNVMEQKFLEIYELSTEAGIKAILDEASRHGEDLITSFEKLDSFYAKALWTLLERPDYLKTASAFYRADTMPQSYWRKLKNLPKKSAMPTPEALKQFEKKLSEYYHQKQGRGKNCEVECYSRNGQYYFFAYPEDYGNASIEWGKKEVPENYANASIESEKQELKRRPHRPAFENIFVYSFNLGTLDIYISGDRKIIPDLQKIFASIILNSEIKPEKKDDLVYDLSLLRSKSFQFVFDSSSNILDVTVKKLRLTFYSGIEKIVLEADTLQNRNVVYDRLANLEKVIPATQFYISQVGLRVILSPEKDSTKERIVSFDITAPNSCTLKHNKENDSIRKMLIASGIEPRIKTTETDQSSADANVI